MLRLTALSLLFFIFFPVYISAQQKLSGTVVEKATNEPIPFATVQIKDGKSSLTNENGEFEFIVKELPVTIGVSHLNYVAAILKVTTADQPLKISMESQVMTLKEVSVTNPAVAIMREVVDKAFKNYQKSYYGKAFLRQIAYNNDQPTYLNEIVFDAEWKSYGLVAWNPLQARHLQGPKGLSYTNSSFYSFILSGYLLNNHHKKPVLKSLDSLYTYRLLGAYEINGQEIVKILCKPRPILKGVCFEGTYYVNTVTHDVLKIEGIIKSLSFKDKGPVKVENVLTSLIAQYKLNKNGDNVLDYSVLNSDSRVNVSGTGATDTHLYSTLYMLDEEAGNKKKLKPVSPDLDDSRLVKSITYNDDYWAKNQGIKRTDKEQSAIEILEKIPQVKK